MNFRTATDHDLEQLAAMRWDWRVEDASASPGMARETFVEECARFLSDGLRDGTWVYWLAEDGGRIAAHLFVHRIRKVPKPSRMADAIGYVTNVYTRPEYRGRRVGSALLQQVVSWAREEDLDVLVVWPSDESVRFYERSGFRSHNDIMELELREDG